MAGFDVNIPRDPIGVKGTDGSTIASPTNPIDVQERPVQVGPFSRSGAFASTDAEWTSSTLDWFSDPAQNLGHAFYAAEATAAGSPTIDVTEEVSNDGSTWHEGRVFTLDLSQSTNRRFPVEPHGFRYVRLRAGPPSADMTTFNVSSMYTADYGRSTPRTAGDILPNDSHLDAVNGAELYGIDPIDGRLEPVPTGPNRALMIEEEGGPITPLGAKHVTGLLDYVSHDFGTGSGAANIAALQDLSSGGTVTHDATNGGAVFSTGAAAGNTAIFLSEQSLPYSENTGHAMQFDLTVLLDPTSAAISGDAYIEWGIGDGAGNGFGFGYDASGYYAFLKKGGTYISQDYQANWNGDRCDGGEFSLFKRAGTPEAIRIDRFNYYRGTSQFLYAGEQVYRVKNPNGRMLTAHTHEFPNAHVETSLKDADLNVYVEIHNDTSSGGDIVVRSGSWHGAIYTNKTTITVKDSVTGTFHDTLATPLGDSIVEPSRNLDINAYTLGYDDGSGTWNRIRSRQPVDNMTNPGKALNVAGFNMLWNPSGSPSNRWNRFIGQPGTDAMSGGLVSALTLARLQVYNGSTWDRVRGDITNGVDVDVTRSALPTGAATSAKQDTLAAEFTSEFTRIKEKRFKDTEEVRHDIPVSLISGQIYTGKAPAGSATSATVWDIVRVDFDASGNPSRERIQTGIAWDSRTSGWT